MPDSLIVIYEQQGISGALTSEAIFFTKRHLTKPNFFYKNEKQFLLIELNCK